MDGDLIMKIFGGALLLSAVGMPLLTLLCVTMGRGKRRKHLLLWIIALLGILGAVVVSGWVLNWFDLAWRPWVLSILSLLLLACIVGVLVQTVNGCAELLRERQAATAWKVIVIPLASAACSLVVLTVLLLGLLFVASNSEGERVVTWEGQRAVEIISSWDGAVFHYYPYHGPLVQGRGRLGSSDKPAE